MTFSYKFRWLLLRVKVKAWLRRSFPTFRLAWQFLRAWYAYLRLRFLAWPVTRAVARFLAWVERIARGEEAPRLGHDPIWMARAKRGNRRGRSHWDYNR